MLISIILHPQAEANFVSGVDHPRVMEVTDPGDAVFESLDAGRRRQTVCSERVAKVPLAPDVKATRLWNLVFRV